MKIRTMAAALAAMAGVAHADEITTTFVAGNSGDVLWTLYFDVTVTNPAGLNITSFDVNTTETQTGLPVGLDIYITAPGGAYSGNEFNPAAWTHVANGTGTTAGLFSPSMVNTGDFTLAPGTYGMAIRYFAGTPAYTDGDGNNQNYANADITLALGSSANTQAGPFTGIDIFTPRVWNGTIHYTAVPAPGSLALLGLGGLIAARRRRA